MGLLNDSQVQDFLSRNLITTDMVGHYGLIVKDQGRLIDAFKTGDHLAFIEVPAVSLPSYSNMMDGEIRNLVPTTGHPQEATIAQITIGAIENPVYDPSYLKGAAEAIGKVVGDTAAAVGDGLNPLTKGIGAGLSSLLEGLIEGAWPILLIGGAAGVGYWWLLKKGFL